jgi:hypothetical protein
MRLSWTTPKGSTMAVRDEEQHTAEVVRVPEMLAGGFRLLVRGLSWREALGHVPALLLLGGLLMYAYLSVCYERFYGSLGVEPNDVGLTYTGTLARSSGFVIVYLLIFLLWLTGPLAMLRALSMAKHDDSIHASERGERRFAYAMVLLPVAVVVWILSWPLSEAEDAARYVRAGKPVAPITSVLPITVLAIHASPATVEPAGKPEDSPAAERLQGRHLQYLGRADGTVVLYDPAAQRAVYLPSSAVIVHVANCRGKPAPDPAC